jgi:hypothetical protein
MQQFVVGDRVIIRYGKRAGAKATIIRVQLDQAYQVRSEDGTVLFFTGAGLEGESATPRAGTKPQK